jgi:hypothetical protein
MLNFVRQHLSKRQLSYEALVAYFNRLPDAVQVDWFRDGNFIIGNVKAGENEFVTQGLSADDFINTVNESVITVNNIPYEYFDVIKELKSYMPPEDQIKALEDQSVSSSKLRVSKSDRALQAA